MHNSTIFTFKNDYNTTCHPTILEALQATMTGQHEGYGLDSISKKTEKVLQEICQSPHAQVHFLSAGTITNALSIAAFLRPHQAVIAVESGHINVHETGAIEATGHKVLTAQSHDGKLHPHHIESLMAEHDNEHMVQAKMVYISQATELGTVYTTQEVRALSETCKRIGLYLFVDGARLGAAMTCGQESPNLAELALYSDAFYVGGTKNGALFGEALILTHEHVQKDFRYLCKQRGAMLAKGWLVAAQFEALFQEGLYYDLAKHANKVAAYLDKELSAMNVPLLTPTVTNQIFPVLPVDAVEKLQKSYAFEMWQRGQQEHTIRFVTSWNTSMEDATALLSTLKKILA